MLLAKSKGLKHQGFEFIDRFQYDRAESEVTFGSGTRFPSNL